jgi:hypothetical protein
MFHRADSLHAARATVMEKVASNIRWRQFHGNQEIVQEVLIEISLEEV